MPRLAASCCGSSRWVLGGATIVASEQQPPEGALGCPRGVFKGCAPEGTALK